MTTDSTFLQTRVGWMVGGKRAAKREKRQQLQNGSDEVNAVEIARNLKVSASPRTPLSLQGVRDFLNFALSVHRVWVRGLGSGSW
jgi:hypothetical protein